MVSPLTTPNPSESPFYRKFLSGLFSREATTKTTDFLQDVGTSVIRGAVEEISPLGVGTAPITSKIADATEGFFGGLYNSIATAQDFIEGGYRRGYRGDLDNL
jgi:hypothetical protein